MLRELASTSCVQKKNGKEEKLTFDGIPLHAVLMGDLSEVFLHDSGQRVVVEVVMIDLGSKVELSLGLELVM